MRCDATHATRHGAMRCDAMPVPACNTLQRNAIHHTASRVTRRVAMRRKTRHAFARAARRAPRRTRRARRRTGAQ
ncbi:hypothetical protein DM49_3775 [Burkholderia mallei]|nr:hypothetical protein DM49_3775 [Burkholderia mallei]